MPLPHSLNIYLTRTSAVPICSGFLLSPYIHRTERQLCELLAPAVNEILWAESGGQGRAVLCVPMDAHSPAREWACTSAPIGSSLLWWWWQTQKRRNQESRWGTPEEEIQGLSVKSLWKEQVTIPCLLFKKNNLTFTTTLISLNTCFY